MVTKSTLQVGPQKLSDPGLVLGAGNPAHCSLVPPSSQHPLGRRSLDTKVWLE